jgi:filamentous hemagglutinin
MAITRIKNNQVTDASAGNVYLGINAAVKLQDFSVTAGKIANSLVYGSDLTVTGNLTVNGQTTTIDTVSVVIEDPILYLAANQTGAPSLDIGFIGERGTSQNITFVWDESAGEFVTGFTNDTTTNSTVTIASYADFHTNNANIGGNIVINGTTSFVGNIISPVNITGNFSAGNISTPGQISAVGNISGGNVNAVANVETANLRVTSMTANLVTFTDPNDYLITSQNFSYDGVTANIQGVLVVDGFTINGTDITSSANVLITSNAGNANIDITPTGTGVVNIGNITIGNNTIGSSFANIVLNPAANIVLPDETASAVLYLTANKEIESSSNFVYDGTTANIQGALVIDNVKVDGNDISTTNANGNLTLTPNGTGSLIVDAEDSNFLGNLTTSGNLVSNAAVIATGNVSGGNITTAGQVVATGNITGGNVNAISAITAGTTINATGNITGGNVDTAGQVVATGNITGGNLITAGLTSTATLNASGNANVGNLGTAGLIVATGNITGGNLTTAGLIVATGNITGGNLTTAGITSTGSLTASTTINATGNITGGNIDTAGITSTGSLTASTTINATGNITGGNLITTGVTSTGTLETTGNALIGGNLVVQGNITYINIDDLRVEDPIIILGTGPNGAPLTVNDGKDRGIFMEYYDTSLGNAFMGWDNSSGNMIIANDAFFTGNDVVGINSYGTLEVGNVFGQSAVFIGNVNAGNLISQGAVIGNVEITGNLALGNLSVTGVINTTGNITGGNLVSNAAISAATTINATGNITGGNLTTVGITSTGSLTASTTINATGNITGGNLTTVGITSTGSLTASTTINATGNITGGNIDTAGITSTSSLTASTTINATGNITGGNLTTAGQVVATGNVTGGNLTTAGITSTGSLTASTTINATGNITGGNIDTAGQVVATGNITGGNLITAGLTSTATLNASGNANVGNLGTAGLIVATGNITGGNIDTAGQVVATGNITGGNLTTAGITSTGSLTASTTINATGNITGGNLSAGSGIISTTGNVNGGNVNATAAVTGANLIATGNVTGANIVGTTSGTFGNIVISGDDITDTNGRVNFNTAGADVDFAVNGDTVANVFYVDAGTGTASFGNATQTTGAVVSFNTNNSILVPVGNSAQRPTGATGMIRFNTTLDNLEFYDADGWVSAGSVFTVIDSQVFNGDGSTVAFTLDTSQTTDSCIVSINGIVQIPVTAYAVAGTILTFTEAPLSQDVIEVRKITTTVTVKAISNSVGNAIIEVEDTSSNVYITGNLVPVANNAQDLGSQTLRWKDGYFSGNSITLGNIVLKNTSGNTLSFFGPDGTTPGVLSSNNVDTTSIANGNASVQTLSASGNVVMTSGGVAQLITYPGGVVIPGNLLVQGTETVINVSNLNVEDPILALGRGANNTPLTSDDDLDRGVEMYYYVTGVGEKAAFMGWEDSANTMIMAQDVSIANNVVTINNFGSLRVGSLLTSGILNTNANGVGNIGNSSTYFNTAFIKATSAQYADLAENYEADATYEPGTVVCFGGAKEVTVCDVADSTRVAGVISTNPSYLMNSGQTGAHVAAVALQGRVPTKVTGQIRKGDLIVSAGDGRGRVNNDARAGTIIGKALADFDGQDGVIEVVVGRV